ncbi:hypothetical protein ACB098_12G017400 [Castanea mollissima]
MFWNYFGKPDYDLHCLTLGHFFLIHQFHAPAQECFAILSVIQISLFSLSTSNRLSLLWMLTSNLGTYNKESASSNTKSLPVKAASNHLIASDFVAIRSYYNLQTK